MGGRTGAIRLHLLALAAAGSPAGSQDEQARSLKDAAAADHKCLLWQGDGCEAIKDRDRCVSSRDGRPWQKWNGRLVQGQPCVWCGEEGRCPQSSGSICEPLSWATPKDLVVQNYTVARCKSGENLADKLNITRDDAEMSPDDSFLPMDDALDRACRGSHPLDSGDGVVKPWLGREKSYNMWTAQDLEHCKSFCTGSCTGIEWNEADKYCEVWLKPIRYSAHKPGYQCYVRPQVTTSPAPKLGVSGKTVENTEGPDASCLSSISGGCNSIDDMLTCLRSRDGRGGLDVHGDACVWCGGSACTNETQSRCDSYSSVLAANSGQLADAESGTFFTTAACRDGSPLPVRVKAKEQKKSDEPSWKQQTPSESDMSCLSWYMEGCHKITDRETCLGSRDGRGNDGRHGLKYNGQPCVWCNGPCTDRSDNHCEPFEYLMKGEAQALFIFYAKNHFSVAKCNEKVSLDKQEFECLDKKSAGCPALKDQQTCVRSRDGRSNITGRNSSINGQPCVWCKAGECGSKDAKCEAFDLAWIDSPDPAITFQVHGQNVTDDMASIGTCKGGKLQFAHILPPLLAPGVRGQSQQGVREQCGGTGWTGATKCRVGTMCMPSEVRGESKILRCTDEQTLWGQCGGNSWTGPTKCRQGSTCVRSNNWLSRCLPEDTEGTFISPDGTSIWWQGPASSTKHRVEPKSCEHCGCADHDSIKTVSQAELNSLSEGKKFDCSMMASSTNEGTARVELQAQPLRQLKLVLPDGIPPDDVDILVQDPPTSKATEKKQATDGLRWRRHWAFVAAGALGAVALALVLKSASSLHGDALCSYASVSAGKHNASLADHNERSALMEAPAAISPRRSPPQRPPPPPAFVVASRSSGPSRPASQPAGMLPSAASLPRASLQRPVAAPRVSVALGSSQAAGAVSHVGHRHATVAAQMAQHPRFGIAPVLQAAR